MNVDLKEFRSAFVAEAEEHLSAIRGLLLAVDRTVREKNAKGSQRELRELMRLLHTVKGLAAMVGVEPIVTIAHKMESVVRMAERAGGSLDERAIEVLIAGTRAIEARIRSVAENRAVASPSSDLLESFESLEVTAPVAQPTLPLDPTLTAKLGASEQQQLRDGARSGRRALRVDFAPSAEKASQGTTITSVRERLNGVAEVVKVIPMTLPPSAEMPGGLVFALLLLTNADDEQIAEAAGVETSKVTLLLEAEVPVPREIESQRTAEEPDDDDSYGDSGRGVLRVEVGRVDDAIDMLGSLVVTRSRMAHAVERLEVNGVDTRELRVIMSDNARQLRELRAAILRVRMIPMAAVLDRLPLVVRSLGRTSGKQVRVALDVGTAELDKTVAERLFPALVHLVRNAVAHGVESPAERAAAGKSETATLTIKSTTVDRNVEIRLSDDGRGVDRAAVAASARAPIPTSDAALLDLLCKIGMSTRAELDTTSGRGLGMDIVRKIVVHRLGGELTLETHAGVGTTFALRVPLTVAIVDAFTVRCGGERFAVPVPIVEEIIELSDERVVSSPSPKRSERQGESGQRPSPKIFARRGLTVPIFDLAEALDLPSRTSAPHGLLVRRGAGELVAYAVERVLGQQEIVVRPLVDPLVSSSAISGSTDLGDGRATVVLDLLALSSLMESGEGRAA